jgi:large subunit ribosomal protein L13
LHYEENINHTTIPQVKQANIADSGDYVVVKNARHLFLTGNKAEQKEYNWHSGFPGGLKTVKFNEFIEDHPTGPIKKAVWGMLPKNRLRRIMMKRLKVFPDEEHPYGMNIFKVHDQEDPLYKQSVQPKEWRSEWRSGNE